jgi:hypothetical protein
MFAGAIKFGDSQMKYPILQNCVWCLIGEIIAPYIANEEAKNIYS